MSVIASALLDNIHLTAGYLWIPSPSPLFLSQPKTQGCFLGHMGNDWPTPAIVKPPLHRELTAVRGLQLSYRKSPIHPYRSGLGGWGISGVGVNLSNSPLLSANTSKELTILPLHLTSNKVKPGSEEKNVDTCKWCTIRWRVAESALGTMFWRNVIRSVKL